MKKFNACNKEKATKKFLQFKENKMNSKKPSFFILIKDEKIALRNFPFQFNQKRYKRKTEKLLSKKNNHYKQDIQLLNIFVRYLKTYSVYFKSMQKENGSYNIKIDNQILWYWKTTRNFNK